MKFFGTGSPESEPSQEDEKPRLSTKNWLNLCSYVINLVITYGVGNAGWFGNGTNTELSEKYQTLVTPNGSAFSIWAVIFVFQGIFAVMQMFPRWRAQPMVQDGVSYWYVGVCLTQVAWTITFAYEVIWLSMLFIFAIWGCLCFLLYSQYYTTSNGSLVEFWFLRFPFAIHCGWLTAASVLNVNVLMVDRDEPADVQLAVAVVSLAYLHAVSVWVLFGIPRPNYTIAGVLSWATGWIYAELQEPKESIVILFGSTIVSAVAYAAIAVAFIILTQMVVRVSYFLLQKYACKGKPLIARGDPNKTSSEGEPSDEEAATVEPTDTIAKGEQDKTSSAGEASEEEVAIAKGEQGKTSSAGGASDEEAATVEPTDDNV